MNTFTRLKATLQQRQRGAVVIMFALSLLVLFGFMALVFDLGRTYVVRTELQNAADAAALAGAKDLNQKLSGITKATATVNAIGKKNRTKFSFNGDAVIDITPAMIRFSNCPRDTCDWKKVDEITSANVAEMTFLKVEIPSGDLATFFARIAGIATTSTYGRAVAGWFVIDISPIGVCAIKNEAGKSRPEGEALPGTNELAQFGFRHGVSYNIFNLGPLGGPSDPYLLNPLDTPPNHCDPNNSSANATAPFICSGSAAFRVTIPGYVYGNTGVSSGTIEAALNSRFNDYKSPSVCIPAEAPPDKNIKNYGCTGIKPNDCVTPAANWMAPTDQTITPTGIPTATVPHIPAGITSKNQYGVLWSYSRAVTADTSTTPPKPGTDFAATSTDWANLYPAPDGSFDPNANSNFPGVKSPYLNDTTPGSSGTPNRRVLNLVIADCPEVIGTGSCSVIPVLGIGRFFMQVPADFKGSPKKLEVEFDGLNEPLPKADIRLYR